MVINAPLYTHVEATRNDNDQEFKARMRSLAPEGVDHIVEVAGQ